MQETLGRGISEDVNIPGAQLRAPTSPLEGFAGRFADRDRAIVAAYERGHYSYQGIASYFGLHVTTVSRIVRWATKGEE